MFTAPQPPGSISPESLLRWAQEGFQQIENAFQRLGKREFYQPVWTSGGTQPSLGNGSLQGSVVELGSSLIVSFGLSMGSTTTFGTGGWTISAPKPQTSFAPNFAGSLWMLDSSASTTYSGSIVLDIPGVKVELHAATGQLSPTNPFTWAANDLLIGTLVFPRE